MSKRQQQKKKGQTAPAKQQRLFEKANPWLLMVVCIALAATVMFPVTQNDFTNWDDESYVVHNNLITSLDGAHLKGIFSENVVGNYHPFTVLSFAVDYAVFGPNAEGFHTTNLFLHLLNIALVFWFIFLLTGHKDLGLITAVLFGIHPMHVESVAWISGRKDLVFTLFYLGAMLSYLKYLAVRETKGKPLLWLGLTGLLFFGALMGKAVAVTLPLVLVLLDWFKERQIDVKALVEKLPFVAIAIVFGILAIQFQNESEAIHEVQHYNWFEQIFVGSYGITTYLARLFIPFKLSAFYPYPAREGGSMPSWMYFSILPVVILGYFGWRSLKNSKKFVFGIAFFLLTISLTLQIIPVGDAILADRYTYLPYLGLFLLLGYAFAALREGKEGIAKQLKPVAPIALAAYILTCSFLSFNRIKVWENSETLWTDVIEKYPAAFIAYNNRGNFRASTGKLNLAFDDFNESLRRHPNNSEALTNRGLVYKHRNMYKEALADYAKALEIDAKNYKAWMNQGNILRDQGKLEPALASFNKCLEINPNYDKAYNNRGIALKGLKKYPEAIQDFSKAMILAPNEPFYPRNRGTVYAEQGKYENAINDYNAAVKLNPNFADAIASRSDAYYLMQNWELALRDARDAQRLGKKVRPEYIAELEARVSN